ncbi:hypothetical protein DYB32_000633 [Aphanomyces invadans]|uniref:CENP-V/GFA domain-containing protein n=1 Tax=Aphanomyces invadans TaxID=157072 RepID=A0A418B9G6_9STRA|nr:hypothetical protein DYB32_000633 [Aphanomyces invadans]
MKAELAVAAIAGVVSWIGWTVARTQTVQIDAAFGCSCGKVQGHVLAPSGLHIVCYCDDCQKFGDVVCKDVGNSPVDKHGGTDIVQVFPADVVISHGKEHVTIGKLTEKTKLLRVFASCCQTPLFNAQDDVAFIGLLTSVLKTPQDTGPVQFRIMGKFAKSLPREPVASIVSVTFVVMFFARSLLVYRSRAYPTPLEATMPRVILK